jgi:hypothetical protein
VSAFRRPLAQTGGRPHLPIERGTRPGPILGAALLLVSSAGVAQEPSPQVTPSKDTVVALEFIGPRGCGSESQFKASVATRSERIQFGSSSEDSRSVRVELSRRAGGVVLATLTLIQSNGRRSARKIEASSCDEAVDAIALVTAVTLDPLGVSLSATPSHANNEGKGGAGGASGSGGTSGAAGTSSGANGGESTKAGPSSGDAGSAGTAGRVPGLYTDPFAASGEGGTPWFGPGNVTWIAGAAFLGTWGAAPSVLPGAAVFVSVSNERNSVLSPALRMRLSHSARGGFEEPGGTASFRVDVATLELCPFRLGSESVHLRPCGFVTGGVLGASGEETTEAQDHNRPWGAAGGTLAFAVRPIEQLSLECFGSIGRPFVRDSFQFDPTVFHEVWSMIPSVGLGTGFIFR